MKSLIEKIKSLSIYFNNRFIIKDLNEDRWYIRTYKGHKYPNFVSSTGYAKKYKCYLIAQIISWKLGNCIVQTYR